MYGRCGSEASIALPEAERDGATAQLFEPPEESAPPPAPAPTSRFAPVDGRIVSSASSTDRKSAARSGSRNLIAASPAARFSSRPVNCQKKALVRAIVSRGDHA